MLSYFLENNKSGYKSTEKWLSKNNNDLYTKIINHGKINNNDSIPFKEKIYRIYDCGSLVYSTGP